MHQRSGVYKYKKLYFSFGSTDQVNLIFGLVTLSDTVACIDLAFICSVVFVLFVCLSSLQDSELFSLFVEDYF